MASNSGASEGVREGWRWGPGASIGLGLLSDSGLASRGKTGIHLHADGSIIYYRPTYVWDGSLGFSTHYMSGSDALGSSSVFNTAFQAGLGIRWRFGRDWQLGPSLDILAGQDVGFAESSPANAGSSKLFAFLAGIKLLRESTFLGLDWRWGPFASASLGLAERQLYLAGATISLELPFGRAPAEMTKSASSPRKGPQIARISGTSVLLNLDSYILQFATNLAVLPPDKMELIKAIGRFMKDNSRDWDSARVLGHADITGNQLYNLRLSDARAHYVRELLLNGGTLESSRITAIGYGATQPLDQRRTPEAYALNRRVEIYLDGAKRPAEFVTALNKLIDDRISHRPVK